MATKALYSFKQKIHYFDDDIDLIDILIASINNGDLTDTSSQYVIKNLDPSEHIHLARRSNSNGSRDLIINHLKQTLYSSYIKDIYEEVTHYLRSITRLSLKNSDNPNRIIGEHEITFTAKQIISLENWENLCDFVADGIFQKLENEKSTIQLLKKINSKLGLNIEDVDIKSALPYLEIRHFLVHTDGKVTNEFKTKYPFIKVNKNNSLKLSKNLIKETKNKVCILMEKYDDSFISNNLASPEDLQ